jgi:DNA-3-methyladenine glycosylase
MKSSEPNSQKLKTDYDPLSKRFFLRDTVTVARELLGKGIYILSEEGPMLAEIVEVEAYLGGNDPASHAYRGITKRNWPMFEGGGICYVYLSYGVNFCMNVSTREKGAGEAVLFRALRPLHGELQMKKNRGMQEGKKFPFAHISNGPGKLTQALGVDLSYNGFTFDRHDFRLVDLGRRLPPAAIGQSPRIGISKARDLELRYFIKSSPWLSR